MKYIVLVIAILLIFGTSCTEEQLQQQQMDRETDWAKTLQKKMFFFQEKESQLCFAVAVGPDFNIAHVPCDSVKNLLIRAEED